MDERIIIRHLNMSKAGQTEEFPVKMFKELTAGREAGCEIKYDPDRDDLVSRRHAKIMIEKQDPLEVSVVDLGSRNGTFVNKQRISSPVKLSPGDTVQFGAGGPEFQFDIEPRPAGARPTRLGGDQIAVPPPVMMQPTRESNSPMMGMGGGMPSTAYGPAGGHSQMPPTSYPPGPPPGVGKATVERMIVTGKTQTRNQMLIVGLLLFVALAAVAAYVFTRKPAVNTVVREVGPNTMSPTVIADAARDAVVLFEVSWKLIDVENGRQLNQVYIPNVIKNQEDQMVEIIKGANRYLPVFVSIGGSMEPVLSTSDGDGKYQAIGGMHSGSGFVVSSDGFILTNRHVAATWFTSYHWLPDDQVGIELTVNDKNEFQIKRSIAAAQFPVWVPANARFVIEGSLSIENARLKRKPMMGKAIEGRNDYLDVTFANNRIRIPAKLARVSDQIDVSMTKIDMPRSLKKLELNDNYGTIKPGDAAIVMGYPAVAPAIVAVTGSKDVFNASSDQKVVPDPTVSVGNIGRVIRGGGDPNATGDGLFSPFGELYQLTINSTGGGNSGGPVFDDHGRVIAIYTSGRAMAGASVSFAVPIKYGMELMGVGKDTK